MTVIKPYNKAEVAFQLGKEIGHEGSNSQTFVAHDDQLDAQIVIKKLRKTSIASVDQYFEESKILYLSSHPHVVQVIYACQDADHIYIAMPYYAKGSLNTLMNSRFLRVREIVTLGCQIAAGLHNIHSKRLIHFDVKPDNVLLSDRGEALVSDFGLSKRIGHAGTAEQDRLYFKMCPPEAYKSEQHTSAFDVYQFGLTLYRMCVGNEEFYRQFASFGTTAANFRRDEFKVAVRNGQFPDRDMLPEHIPARLRSVIKDCLAPEPTDRTTAVIEAANGLAQVDEKLDWQYTVSAQGREWSRRSDTMEYRISVGHDGSAYAQKGRIGGSFSRISAYCTPAISTATLKKFLKET
jgi:eukaryotic-like serine/threonine-protein kinase